MELVVHEPFPFNGTDYARGDVVKASDADGVRAHHIFRSYVSARAAAAPSAPASAAVKPASEA